MFPVGVSIAYTLILTGSAHYNYVGALKKSHMMGTASSPCSPHERVPITQDGKLLLSNMYVHIRKLV